MGIKTDESGAGEGENKSINVSREQGREGTQTSKQKTDETAGDGKTSAEGADETGSQKEGDGSGEGQGDEKDDINPDTKKPYTASEWKKKFSDSSRGAQDLLTRNNTLTTTATQLEAKIADITKEMDTLRALAEGKNPEGVKLADLQAELAKVTNEAALNKEERMLDVIEKAHPLASTVREALRSLSRANPKVDLQKLYDDNLKAGVEAKAKQDKEDEEKRKRGAGDRGQGTSKRESAGDTVITPSGYDTGLSLEDFNKLPVEKRRDLLSK